MYEVMLVMACRGVAATGLGDANLDVAQGQPARLLIQWAQSPAESPIKVMILSRLALTRLPSAVTTFYSKTLSAGRPKEVESAE